MDAYILALGVQRGTHDDRVVLCCEKGGELGTRPTRFANLERLTQCHYVVV